MTQELKEILQVIGAKGAHIYEVYTTQQVLTGYGEILDFFVYLSLALVLVYGISRIRNWCLQSFIAREWGTIVNENAIRPERVIFGIVLPGFVCLTLVLSAFNQLQSGVKRILNPEYYTIQTIINDVKGPQNNSQ